MTSNCLLSQKINNQRYKTAQIKPKTFLSLVQCFRSIASLFVFTGAVVTSASFMPLSIFVNINLIFLLATILLGSGIHDIVSILLLMCDMEIITKAYQALHSFRFGEKWYICVIVTRQLMIQAFLRYCISFWWYWFIIYSDKNISMYFVSVYNRVFF